MKRILALILSILLLCATLAGCGTKGKLVGTWQADIDLAELMENIIGGQWISESYEVSSFSVTLELTFRKDNTFVLAPSQESLNAATEKVMQNLEQTIMNNLQAQLDTLGGDVDLQALLEITGVNPDLLMEEFRRNFQDKGFAQSLADSCTLTGWYKISGDKLYLSETEDIDKDTCPYLLYTLEDGALTVSAGADLPLRELFIRQLELMTFHKA